MVKLLALSLMFLVACGRSPGDIDTYIGAACTRDSQCDDRCYLDSGTFPGGFCSVPCTRDADCPSDTVCTDRAGGVCMYLCSELDCRRLGPGWQCKEKDNIGGGKDFVCIGD
jgi:hypothetical protein